MLIRKIHHVAYDLATGYRDPRIWTAERDKEMWAALER